MVARGSGRIVNVVSFWDIVGVDIEQLRAAAAVAGITLGGRRVA